MLHCTVRTQDILHPAILIRQTSEPTGLTPVHRSQTPGRDCLSVHIPSKRLLNEAGLLGQVHNTLKQTAFHF